MLDETELRALFPMQTPRRYQWETTLSAYNSLQECDNVIISAPTGSGKTAVAITLARAYAQNPSRYNPETDEEIHGAYVTSPLVTLVQQVASTPEFKDYIVSLSGRSNYDCHLGLGNCGDKWCSIMNAREKRGPEGYKCIFSTLMQEAAQASVVNTTLDLLLVAKLGTRHLLVVDEAHHMEGCIARQYGVEFREDHIVFPDHATFAEYKPWLVQTRQRLAERMRSLTDDVTTAALLDTAKAREANRAEVLFKKLQTLINSDVEWVVRKEASFDWRIRREVKKLIFTPVEVRKLLDRTVFKLAPKRVFLSATPPTPQELGLSTDPSAPPDKRVVVIEVPSTFPVANRLVVLDAIGKMGYKHREQNMARCAARIVYIAQHGRTIVHAPSYYVARRLSEEIAALGVRHVLQERDDRLGSLEKWKSGNDNIFLSCAMRDGIDLPDDLCRFVIFPAIPWPDMRDPAVKRRIELEGDAFYYANTARAIVQGAGRGVRHENDHSVTYILDTNMNLLFAKAGDAFPAWFKEAIVRKSTGGKAK